MADQGSKIFKGTPSRTATGGAGNQLGMIRNAAKRRISSNRGGEPGGGPPGTKGAGSMIKPNPRNGVYSTFVKENWAKRRKA